MSTCSTLKLKSEVALDDGNLTVVPYATDVISRAGFFITTAHSVQLLAAWYASRYLFVKIPTLMESDADAASALEIVCYTLAGVYALVAAWCIWRLILLQCASPRWTQQKLSHALALTISAGALSSGFLSLDVRMASQKYCQGK